MNFQRYGGNSWLVRIYRAWFESKTSLASMWKGNPILTTVIFGLPFGFLMLICYGTFCQDILDADEDEDGNFFIKFLAFVLYIYVYIIMHSLTYIFRKYCSHEEWLKPIMNTLYMYSVYNLMWSSWEYLLYVKIFAKVTLRRQKLLYSDKCRSDIPYIFTFSKCFVLHIYKVLWYNWLYMRNAQCVWDNTKLYSKYIQELGKLSNWNDLLNTVLTIAEYKKSQTYLCVNVYIITHARAYNKL